MADHDIEANPPFYLTLTNWREVWPEILKLIRYFIDEKESACVLVTDKPEIRRAVQNRLLHRWIGIIAERSDGTKKDKYKYFAAAKLDHLLPLKLSDEKEHDQAMYERGMIEAALPILRSMKDGHGYLIYKHATDRDLRIEAAHDVIRSKDISVKLFASWLTDIKLEVDPDGEFLTSRPDESQTALDEQRLNDYMSNRYAKQSSN